MPRQRHSRGQRFQCRLMMASVRARKRIHCPHCEESVSHATYYRHRERFYDPRNDQWTRGLKRHVAGAGDCDSSSSDEINDLSTRSRSPLQSSEGLQDDSFGLGSVRDLSLILVTTCVMFTVAQKYLLESWMGMTLAAMTPAAMTPEQ